MSIKSMFGGLNVGGLKKIKSCASTGQKIYNGVNTINGIKEISKKVDINSIVSSVKGAGTDSFDSTNINDILAQNHMDIGDLEASLSPEQLAALNGQNIDIPDVTKL